MKTNSHIVAQIIELFELSNHLKFLSESDPDFQHIKSFAENLYNELNTLFLAHDFQRLGLSSNKLLLKIHSFINSSNCSTPSKYELEKLANKLVELQKLVENE